MGMLKSVDGPPISKWVDFMSGITYALCVEQRRHVCQTEYLEELDRTSKLNCPIYRDSQFVKRVGWDMTRKTPKLQHFLDFAVWIDLASYVQTKAPTMTQEQLEHAAKFQGLWKADLDYEDLPRNKQISPFRGSFAGEARVEDTDGLHPATSYHGVLSRMNAKQALNDALSLKKRESRKGRWSRAKSRVFG